MLGEYVSTVARASSQGSDSPAPLVSTEHVAVALVGPTASGKSALAHALAFDHHDTVEILAVDANDRLSRHGHRTAKPTRAERAEVSYHLLDLVEPSDEFTVAQYQEAARLAAADVWRAGHKVLYVGGTGSTVVRFWTTSPIPGQYPECSHAARSTGERMSCGALRRIRGADPLAASRMEATNARRVVRASKSPRGGATVLLLR